jgi:hypothetical protein
MTETTRAANAALVVGKVRDFFLRRPPQPVQQPPREFAEQFGLCRVLEDRLGDLGRVISPATIITQMPIRVPVWSVKVCPPLMRPCRPQ